MKKLLALTRDNRQYYMAALVFLSLLGLFLILTPKPDSFIALNQYHNFTLNVFFVNYTFTGDGLFTLSVCIFLFYRGQKKLALCILASYLSSGLLVQVLKNLIYSPRPRIYFEASQYLFHLDNFGNSGGGLSSFPSGHTTSAFALVTVLAIHFRKKQTGILLFLGAVLTGYSRVYLAQHFPLDILAGAFIGVLFGTLCSYVSAQNIRFPVFNKKSPAADWEELYPDTQAS